MADIRLLIVVKDHEAGHAYAEALSNEGVGYHIAATFEEAAILVMDNCYNGLLIDILTLVRSSKEEKVIAYNCINLYPVLRVKWDRKKKEINLSPLEQTFSSDAETTLQLFIDTRCRPFPARRLRRHSRKEYNLHLLLSPDGKFNESETIKTFSLNISRGGMFLHTTLAFAPGRKVWLRLVEFPHLDPICAVVRWSLEWGLSRVIPGIGVEFDGLLEEQLRVIRTVVDE